MWWMFTFIFMMNVWSQKVTLDGVTLDRLSSGDWSVYTSMIGIDDDTLFLTTKGGEIVRYSISEDKMYLVLKLDVNTNNERGLISIATSGSNIFMYLVRSDGIASVRRGSFTRTSISDISEIWGGDRVGCGNHVGGRLVIDNEATLFVSIGDHCTPSWSQNINEYYGKVLRMNLDGTPVESNPWYSNGGKARYVYARGFRNPFRMYYQESSEKLYVNEVGQNTREAIYNVRAGDNYNWPNNDL